MFAKTVLKEQHSKITSKLLLSLLDISLILIITI